MCRSCRLPAIKSRPSRPARRRLHLPLRFPANMSFMPLARHIGEYWNAQQSEALLRSAYTESLRLASKNHIQSIAFPLISSGIFGYPERRGPEGGFSAITDYLQSSDMDVLLAVFDKTAFRRQRETAGRNRKLHRRTLCGGTPDSSPRPFDVERKLSRMTQSSTTMRQCRSFSFSSSMIANVLANEKYCGTNPPENRDCRLHLQTRRKNTGEAPMYYVQNSHPANY